ncbi:MAG: DNA-binding protein WhiA [Clostridia bacterium]|nr:DNA-binding protein WhiA [Clostridia bacterium]
MSFSRDLKRELSELKNLNKKEVIRHELIGYLISSNAELLKTKIRYVTESEYNINRFAKILDNLGIKKYNIEVVGRKYVIVLESVDISEIAYEESIKINDYEIENETYERAILRGVFLGSGYMNNPKNTYHLELSLSSKRNLLFIRKILSRYFLKTKVLERNKGYCIYLKEGEEISKFLAFIGATEGVIKFEEIRVIRDMKNKVNRMVNCETSNLNKTINASIDDIEDIKHLKLMGVYRKLSKEVKETAEVRLKNPDLSLAEVGKKLKKKVGKSGVNYRLNKISELAKRLKEDEKEEKE